MPNLFLRSLCRIEIVSLMRSLLIAFGTSDSGMWVVASATLRSSVVSIMTDRFTSHNSAKYSVCPLKLNPASLITPL